MLLIAIFSLSHIGYGEGHIAMHRNAHTAKNPPSPTRLSVIYERSYLGKCDFLHLKVDTTYHARGKNSYCYEVTCKHTVSLRSFDSEYTTLDITADNVFIKDITNKQLNANELIQILGYPCHNAIIASNNISWEVWYSDALPHVQAGARTTDGLAGLILEVRNIEKQFTLKAVNISRTI